MTTALEIHHPQLADPFQVAAGQVRLLDTGEAPPVLAAVLGTGPRGTSVRVAGRRVRGRGLAARVRRGLAIVSGAPVAADVSVVDHLAAVVGARRAQSLLSGAPLLADRGDDPAGVLSGGERRVLAWLRAQAMGPHAVLLDRAGEGLDTATMQWAGRAVARWADAGVAVVVRAGRAEERAWVTPGP